MLVILASVSAYSVEDLGPDDVAGFQIPSAVFTAFPFRLIDPGELGDLTAAAPVPVTLLAAGAVVALFAAIAVLLGELPSVSRRSVTY